MNFTSDAIEQNFNNELVTVEVKVIGTLLKNSLGFEIIIVSVVADDNVGILDNILQINQSFG